MYLSSWKYYESIKSIVFFTFHAYVAKVVTFPLHVILIELNACKDEWIVVIKFYKKKKGKQSGWWEKEEEK